MAFESDVKLMPNVIVVTATDIHLDAGPERRRSDTPFRRALVHDFDDGLTINWQRDYPGGVTIEGQTIRVKWGALPQGDWIAGLGYIPPKDKETHVPLDVIIGRILSLVMDMRENKVRVKWGALPQGDWLASLGYVPLKDKESEVPLDVIVSRILSLVMDTRLNMIGAAQPQWRWCKKCEGLFFAGHAKKGVCPAGGEHSTEGSSNYELIHR